MVFGLNALVTKPAISFAPMITVALLKHYGYSSMPSNVLGESTSTLTATVAQHSAGDVLTDAMFYMVCAVPVVVGLLQLFIWHFYTIRDSHKSSYVMPIVA